MGNSNISISEIQGPGLKSPLENEYVEDIHGIVTLVTPYGFFMQDFDETHSALSSKGIFVYTKTRPHLTPYSIAHIDKAYVSEYVSFKRRHKDLTVTTLTANHDDISHYGYKHKIEPVNLTSFSGGVNELEALEGMLVEIDEGVKTVNRINRYYEIWLNTPTPLQIDCRFLSREFQDSLKQYQSASKLNKKIRGVLTYNYGHYEILPHTKLSLTPSNLNSETTFLSKSTDHLSIASYNVKNYYSPKHAKKIAKIITHNLKVPDIIALQEVQDDSGPKDNKVTSAANNLKRLIHEISTLNNQSVNYSFIEIPPQNKRDGGQPGGNIRNVFLVNEDRVKLYRETSKQLFSKYSAYKNTRKPLEIKCAFNGKIIHLVNCHQVSRRQDDWEYGIMQPPQNYSQTKRVSQSIVLKNYVKKHSGKEFIVLGDFNASENDPSLKAFESTLVNLSHDDCIKGDYTYHFQGRKNKLDHILVTKDLFKKTKPKVDIVNCSVDFPNKTSDHNPVISLFEIK